MNIILERAKIPTLPAVARKLVELCRDENATFADFARVIESDPGLASGILKVTNSAYYGLRNKVATLDRAIGILGLKYVKMNSLGFYLASTLNDLNRNGFNTSLFWQQNLLRGVLSRQLARFYCKTRTDEAFLVGLLQNCGIPLLVEALGAEYAQMWKECRGSQASLFRLEQEVFAFDHLKAAAVLTEKWSLPEILSRPICTHHFRPTAEPVSDEMEKLCQIGYFVGTLSMDNPTSLSEEDLSLLDFTHQVFELDDNGINLLLRRSHQEFTNISQLYTNLLPDRIEVAELVFQAHNLLSDLASETTRDVFVLEEEVKLLRQRCMGLTHSMDEYEQKAETDDLTGLAVRDPLCRYLDNACWKVKNDETTLTVIFMDIDNFKDINNLHSHAAGDRLLQELAQQLRSLFGERGCVARYGGDEFIVALMGLQAKQAVSLTQALIEKIRGVHISVRSDDQTQSVGISCSVGMLFCESGSKPGNSSRVLELADDQMYAVKRAGKNDMRYQIVPPDQSEPKTSQLSDDSASVSDANRP
ncbi:MAG: GGDEF domain-containing protein [Sedimentisphaerales bacterium]|nr:GGDEF domain-containing protein [Sedimentisphaerales bacterium]